jgi:hypothetical protein
MRKFIALLLAVVMLFGVAGSAVAGDFVVFRFDQYIDQWAPGVYSDDVVYQTVVDAVYLPQGTVTSYTYAEGVSAPTVNVFDVLPQSCGSGSDKMTRFVFELSNRYRPESQIAIAVSADSQTINTYVYGQYKTDAMYAFVSGIPDCLGNEPYRRSSKSGGGWVDKYSPEVIAETPVTSFQVTSFKVDSTTYTVNDTPQEMDVEPYIKDDRTYVPVRYLAYSLGVDEAGISWDGEAKEVGIVSGETDISLTIGSNTMTVNNDPVIMDVAPEIKVGRTMLPARWVAESLGAEVEWDETTKQAIIRTPVTEPGN